MSGLESKHDGFEEIELSDKGMELKTKFNIFFENLLDNDENKANELQEKITDFIAKLRAKYTTKIVGDYELYHILVGSSPVEKPLHYDFDNEDSIETFINNLKDQDE